MAVDEPAVDSEFEADIESSVEETVDEPVGDPERTTLELLEWKRFSGHVARHASTRAARRTPQVFI